METFAPENCHAPLLKSAPLELSFANNRKREFQSWRARVDKKLRELVGWMPERVPLDIRREFRRDHGQFIEHRIVFTSEANADVPCHLLVPKRGKKPFPVVICLQGHNIGMQLSLGRARSYGDRKLQPTRDFGLQAVREGYAALVMEQRCFGERRDQRPESVRHFKDQTCHHASMTALLLGRTMIGERVWDVSRAIDALTEFPEVDTRRIACMGNSGGGTITYFSACLDPRIGVAMPSCYVCTFRDSIGSIDHCTDNYLPGILRYFEMGDLACLIAPRPLIVVAGRNDPIFPIAAVEENFENIRQIYAVAGAERKCRLVIGEAGHQFYPQEAWPVFREISKW
jgi:cephalosporin-C deacetylase-like acetyl esterase